MAYDRVITINYTIVIAGHPNIFVCVCGRGGGRRGGVGGHVRICRNSRTTGTNPHQSVPSVTSQHVATSQTGTSVEMYRII